MLAALPVGLVISNEGPGGRYRGRGRGWSRAGRPRGRWRSRVVPSAGEPVRSRPAAGGKPAPQANFKHSLAALAQHLEGLLLRHTAYVSETLERICAWVGTGRRKPRPNSRRKGDEDTHEQDKRPETPAESPELMTDFRMLTAITLPRPRRAKVGGKRNVQEVYASGIGGSNALRSALQRRTRPGRRINAHSQDREAR